MDSFFPLCWIALSVGGSWCGSWYSFVKGLPILFLMINFFMTLQNQSMHYAQFYYISFRIVVQYRNVSSKLPWTWNSSLIHSQIKSSCIKVIHAENSCFFYLFIVGRQSKLPNAIFSLKLLVLWSALKSSCNEATHAENSFYFLA